LDLNIPYAREGLKACLCSRFLLGPGSFEAVGKDFFTKKLKKSFNKGGLRKKGKNIYNKRL